ncbi:hypothetical protein M758_6G047500 [Ceratodon purpureus]|nr:hypothetical protein M758_6G047500 [Ceratodon purpureus]
METNKTLGNYKVKMCRDWTKSRGKHCPRGEDCYFAHGVDEQYKYRKIQQDRSRSRERSRERSTERSRGQSMGRSRAPSRTHSRNRSMSPSMEHSRARSTACSRGRPSQHQHNDEALKDELFAIEYENKKLRDELASIFDNEQDYK